ncbi:MAG: FG-GAP-like repeat-containing protein [Bacteroidetes bacterium]|nr:FG-GAP-like repeat-containing protein [Bacteroidota bacterium]
MKYVASTLSVTVRMAMLLFAALSIAVAQVPTITSFSPTSGISGSSVVITGTNFSATASSNVVSFGGAKAAVTSASTTELTATVPAGSTYEPITVVVGGKVAASAKPFHLKFSSNEVINSGSFATVSSSYNASPTAGKAKLFDADRDGKVDIINPFSSAGISALANSTSGNSVSFAAKWDYFETGNSHYDAAIGDVTGDGFMEVITASSGNGKISVFHNDNVSPNYIGYDRFITKTTYTVLGSASRIVTGDVDGDGYNDLVFSHSSVDSISVMRHTGTSGTVTNSTFSARVNYYAGSNVTSLAFRDIDGDGKADIIFTSLTDSTVNVMRNVSTSGTIDASSFEAKVGFKVMQDPYGMAIGDLDNDGKPEISAYNQSSTNFSVLRNTSTSGTITAGSFAARVNFTTGANPRGIAIGDLDGDGKLDIAVGSYTDQLVSVFKNTSTTGSISFASRVNYSHTGSAAQDVNICDVTNDGKPDLNVLVGDRYNVVFKNTAAAAVPVFSSDVSSLSFGSVAVNNSSVDTIWVKNSGTGTLTVSSVSSDNALFTVSPSSTSLTTNDSTAFVVTFTPTSSGEKNGTITFTHNASGSPSTVTVTGGLSRSVTNYSPARTTGITYTSIISTGTSFSWRNGGSNTNDNRSDLTDIGFDFWFMGERFTQFNVSTNGFLDLNRYDNATGAPLHSYDDDNEKFYYQQLTFAPLYDNLTVPSGGTLGGNIKYTVNGTFPNRVLTVEWLNMQVPSNTTPSLNFQVKLYEATGVIEYVYGTMTAGTASYSYTLGIHDNSATYPPTVKQALTQQTVNSTTFSNSPVFSLSSLPESNSTVSFSPPTAPVPTTITLSNVKWNRMTISWDDNAANEELYAVYRSADGGTTFSFVDSLSANTATFTNYGLLYNTPYQWRVCAIPEGGLAFSAGFTAGTTAGTLTGTVTVGPTATYTTLTAAIAAIRTEGIVAATVFELQSNYVSSSETFPIDLIDSNWTSAVKTLTIRPAAGATALSITSSNSTGTLHINKANYVTIDGRPGGSGSAKELTIENTSASGFAVEFKNMAGNNTVRYCVIQGVNTSLSSGVIVFTGSAVDDYGVSNTNGNFNNTVTYCDIRDGATTPANLVNISGISSLLDSNTTFSYNNIFNFFATATNFSRGIFCPGFAENLNVIGNSFYQTASRTATASNTVCAVDLNGPTITSALIKDNIIGGSAANAAGGAFMLGPNTQNVNLLAIYLNSTAGVFTVENNTIKNIDLSTNSTSGTGAFAGVTSAGADTAYVTGNTIGSGTGTGSILVTSASNNGVRGIYGFSGSLTFSNNIVGSITVTNTTTSLRTFIYAISVGTTTELATISGNSIGSSVTPNSINQSNPITVAAFVPVVGVQYNPNGQFSIINNTVSNLTNNYAGTFQYGQVIGIILESSFSSGTISGNSIRLLSTTSQNPNTGALSSVIGISNEGVGDSLIISNNSVDSLMNTAASASVHVVGIFTTANTAVQNTVERNRVYNLYLASSDLTSSLTGIHVYSGSAVYKNNMVNIGNNISAAYVLTGMLDAATDNNSFYFNTLRIGGSGVGTTATNTYAFRRTAAGTDTLKNNIFLNARSNGSTGGKHYAIHLSSVTSLTSNYNDLYVSGAGGVLGFYSSDRTTLALWKSGTGKDANSVNTAVTFVSSDNLHLDGASIGDMNLVGTHVGAITNDIDDDPRHATLPYLGADEASTPLPVELVSFTVSANRLSAELKWKTATEVNNLGFEVERGVGSNRRLEGDGHFAWTKVSFVEGNGTTNAPKEYLFSDRNVAAGKYSYRLKQIDRDGNISYSQEVEVTVGSVLKVFALEQNYPNPFNPSTTIGFTLQESGLTTLKIYDVIGREVATLVNEHLEAGVYHQKTFDGSKLSSGIYFARLQKSDKVQLKKLSLLK